MKKLLAISTLLLHHKDLLIRKGAVKVKEKAKPARTVHSMEDVKNTSKIKRQTFWIRKAALLNNNRITLKYISDIDCL